MLDTTDIDSVVKFIIENGKGLYSWVNKEQLKEILGLHIHYKTLLIVKDKKGILAICRWNMKTRTICQVIDLVIRKHEKKGRKLIKQIILKGLEMYPDGKFLIWERLHKYPNSKPRMYKIEDIVRR